MQVIRVSDEIHRLAKSAASLEGLTITEWAEKVIEKAIKMNRIEESLSD